LSETPTVGFAGLGRMGLPMARNVLRAGFPLVVWNRTASRAEPLVEEGAVADVVVTMLTDGDAVRDVLSASGLLSALRPGSVVVEMSTIGPTAATELA